LRAQRATRGGLLQGAGPGRPLGGAGTLGRVLDRHRHLRPVPPPGVLEVDGRAGHHRRRDPPGPGLLAAARAAVAAGGRDRPHRRDLRVPGPRPLPAAAAGTAEGLTQRPVRPAAQATSPASGEARARQVRVLALAGLAALLAAYDSAILVLDLPGIAAEFQAPVPQLSELGSVLALGALGALPLAALADLVGRRRVLAVAVLCFSLIDVASALAPSLAWLAGARLVGVCFETVTGGVATAVVVEKMPAGRRALAVSGLTLAAGLGIGLTTLAYPLLAPHWRWLYWAGAGGAVAAPVIWMALPDPAVWKRAAHASRTLLRALAEPPFRGRLLLLVAVTAL